MIPQKCRAITIRKIDFSETSQVVRFYSKEYGKLTCIAKGSKRNKGNFLGFFDLFKVYSIVNLPKPPDRLDILTQAEPVKEFPQIPKNIRSFYAACYICDFVDQFTIEEQQNEWLYELLEDSLKELDNGFNPQDLIIRFELKSLKILGHFPRLLECGICKKRLTKPRAILSPKDGGVVCLNCRSKDLKGFLVSTRTLYLMQSCLNKKVIFVNHAFEEARRMLDTHIKYAMEKDLATRRFI